MQAPRDMSRDTSPWKLGGLSVKELAVRVYNKAMAPVGLLLGVAGYILGIYGGLLAAWLLGQAAT